PSAALSSAAEPGDFGERLFEPWRSQGEFSEPPGSASSAREREAPREQGVVFFGYFLLDKHKKVTRPSGRVPTYPSLLLQ
ncbi:MAG: hypothetical protein LBV44_01030, partial [Methylobacillus sp.]|nr:hypothetical protein [Methylobacillus sp.]